MSAQYQIFKWVLDFNYIKSIINTYTTFIFVNIFLIISSLLPYDLFSAFLGKPFLFSTHHAFSPVFHFKYGNKSIIIYAKVYPSDLHWGHVLPLTYFIIRKVQADLLDILKAKITLGNVKQARSNLF